MINETGIFFFSGGGHDHDGQNSSLINVTAYSVFDFEWSTTLGGPDRIRRLDRNYTAFREFIINTVNQSILNPAGIFYQPGSINGGSHIISNSITSDQIAANTIAASNILAGTITANEIASNTITAAQIAANTITAAQIAANTITANKIQTGTITGNLLNANVVLVNQIIASNNYVPGVSGWAIDGDGTAEFDAASIRGTLTAAAVSTPGVEIYSNGVLAASNFVILANGAFGNNNFDVDASGNLTAINANVSGTINASSGSIGGWTASAGTLVGATNATILNPNGQIDMAGNLNASGTVNAGGGMTTSGRINVNLDVEASFYILRSGQVGTGTAIHINANDRLVRFSSLRDLKENIEPLTNAMTIINSLKPRIFNWKPQPYHEDNIHTQQILYNHKSRGFIVEEVEDVSPELVNYSINSQTNTLEPSMWKTEEFIAIAIQGIKELSQSVEQLSNRIAVLEQQLGYNR